MCRTGADLRAELGLGETSGEVVVMHEVSVCKSTPTNDFLAKFLPIYEVFLKHMSRIFEVRFSGKSESIVYLPTLHHRF